MSDTLDTLTLYGILDEIEEQWKCLVYGLAAVGAWYTLKVFLRVSCRLYQGIRTYIFPRLWHSKDFPKQFGGKWAVITGASEGIGRSYAFKLAERKMNVFLISRSKSKLRQVADDIMELYDVQARCYPLDCATLTNSHVFEQLQSELDGLDVGVLVNNVGLMYEKLQQFLTVPRSVLVGIVDLNIHATVLMTNMILPQMVGRKSGAIINISSAACVQPTPMMTTYSASKSFVKDFSSALEYEYRSKGINIQVISPSYVSTNMTKMATPSLAVTHPDVYVESAVRTLGVSRSTYGYWSHGLFGIVMENLPRFFYLHGAFHFNPPFWRWVTGYNSKNE